ncbi:hypothetical protein [Nostoc sp.]|uniref:hypothetical protein n=1 Tax=Nostoc sp. TaxID=1180 RepID=UPI002FF50AFA
MTSSLWLKTGQVQQHQELAHRFERVWEFIKHQLTGEVFTTLQQLRVGVARRRRSPP